jgi:hypothetical protein
MAFESVTPKNALMFALKAYENPQCMSAQEFAEDYKRFKYVKRLCKRYIQTKQVSVRLMLNHLILLSNVFSVEPMVRLLFVKCDDGKELRALKPFLLYLGMLPELVRGVNGKDILTAMIPTDADLTHRLREF